MHTLGRRAPGKRPKTARREGNLSSKSYFCVRLDTLSELWSGSEQGAHHEETDAQFEETGAQYEETNCTV